MSPDEFPMFQTSSDQSMLLQKQNKEESLVKKTANGLKALESIKESAVVLSDPLKNANVSFFFDNCIREIKLGNFCILFKPKCRPLLELFQIHELLCGVLTLALGETFGAIPCDYIPRVDDLIKEDCGACIVIPTVGPL